MKRFIESAARDQVALLPECLDDYVDADNTVRVVDVFVDELDLVGLGLAGHALLGGQAGISPIDLAQALHLRILESNSIESPSRTGSTTESRIDLADRPADTGFLDHR